MTRMRTIVFDQPLIGHLVSWLLLLQLTTAAVSASSVDAPAMQALAKSLSNLPISWSPTSDPCSPSAWEGVACNSGGRVTGINLASKAVTGQLPLDAFSTLTELTSLQLQRNGIVGALPSLAGLVSLQSVFLDGNRFSSIPKDFFSGLSALQRVSMDDVPFTPPWDLSTFADLASASALTEFSASNASVTGPVPDFFGRLPNLQLLRLSYNQLTGGIPASLAGSGIQQLLLNNQNAANKLSGGIDVIGEMSQLVMVWLQSNAFTGPIPDVSNLTSLESFNVRDNQLTGVVPPSLVDCRTLKNVTLSNNLLQGPFPGFPDTANADITNGNNFCLPSAGPCDARVTALLKAAAGFGYPTALANSWKGNNPCGGAGSSWYGVTCDGQQQSVIVLNFANQKYGGVISPAIADLTTLTKIVLSNMNLTGMIPDGLTKLPQLTLLDVSNNSLSGKVPSFAPSVTLKLGSNPLLGSDVLSGGSGGGTGSGEISGSLSTGNTDGGSSSSPSRVALIVGIIVALIFLGGCFMALFLHYRKKKLGETFRRVPAGSPPNEPETVKLGMNGNGNGNVNGNGNAGASLHSMYSHSSMGSVSTYAVEAQGMMISLSSLLRATNNFSEGNIIGRGGFGVVYRGDHNGIIIAVKRNEYSMMGKKGQEEFKAEIDVLKRVKHRNLVSLLGYCDDGQERLLVYEYMSGGTLGQRLFDWRSRNEAPLTWKQRLVIALDVARAIQYLHSLAQESFIHRDLKPSNILLDQDLRAKVSDFGLVKLAQDNQKSMMTRLAGTFGYLAPEYATTGKVTTKVDVYAFGVILMEVITGRKVLDDSLSFEEVNLVTVFRRKVSHEKDRLLEFVDSAMHLDHEDHKSLLEVADLSWHCTAREHHQRPDMSNVVNWLAPLVEQWKPAGTNDSNNEDADFSSPTLQAKLEQWRQHGESSSTDLFSTYN